MDAAASVVMVAVVAAVAVSAGAVVMVVGVLLEGSQQWH